MRIVVDARLIRGGGIGRYIREVTGRWLEEPEVEAIRFVGPEEELRAWLDGRDPRGATRVSHMPARSYSPWVQARWALRRGELCRDADVAFFPHYDAPLLGVPVPSVVTVHDLTQFVLPECFPWAKRVGGRVLLRRAVEHASRIVTVSNATARDLARFHPEAEEKIRVIGNGVSEVFRPLEEGEQDEAEERWGHLRPFLLMVGPRKPHKNLELGLSVLAGLREEAPDLKVVIAGPGGTGDDPLRKHPDYERERARITSLTLLDDHSLRELYHLAEALLFPSLYEGFGLPPLEADACGTSVVASDAGALPETASETTTLLDPTRPEAWIDATRRILNERSKRERGEHERTPVQKRRSWSRCASRTLSTLREATRCPRR